MDARSHTTLTTCNGRNVTLVDAASGHVTAFLDHPYRYLRSGPAAEGFGVERRNLLVGLDWTVGGKPLGLLDDIGYVAETNVVRARFAGGATMLVVAPFGLPLNVALFVLETLGATGAAAAPSFHLGLRPTAEPFWESPFGIVHATGERRLAEARRPGAFVERGPGEGALVLASVGRTAGRIADDLSGPCVRFETGARQLAYVAAYVADPAQADSALAAVDAWLADLEAGALVARELAEWAAWRHPTPGWLAPVQAAVWRQCEAVLRMGQVREPETDGMILASLPPGGWSIGWVRDAAYAAVALARAGYHAEARRWLEFLLERGRVGRYAGWVGGVPYRVSLTRYFGDGTEEVDHAGHATPNIETDGWGLALWAVGTYVAESGDRAFLDARFDGRSVYDLLKTEVADAVVANLEGDPRVMRPDSSIWEVHQENARHFLYTSACAARGLADFAVLAAMSGRADDAARYGAVATSVAAAIPAAFGIGPGGALVGALERSAATDLDAAVIEYFTLDVARDLNDDVAEATLTALEALRLPSGGYRRSASGDAYAAGEWAFVNLRMASLQARRGSLDAARTLIDLTVRRAAANFGLVPETYGVAPADPIGSYTGSVPMVGYGAGLLVLALMDLAEATISR